MAFSGLQICYTYPTIMKFVTVIPHLKKIQKYMNHVTHPLSSIDISISLEISKFCYIKKYRHGLPFDTFFLILLTFLESLNIFLINMVTILMMSAKLAKRNLLKIKVFWNKSHDAIVSVHDSNYLVAVVKWPKFGNSSISVREVIIISIF